MKPACSHFKTIKIKVSLFSCLFDTDELLKTANEPKLELCLLYIQPVALRGQSVFCGFYPFCPVQHSLCLGHKGAVVRFPIGLLGWQNPCRFRRGPLNEPLATPMLKCNSCLVNSFLLTYYSSIRTVQCGNRDHDLGSHKSD